MKGWFAAILIFCAQSVWAQSPIAITFNKDEVGRLPSGWVSENQKDMTKVYSVQAILTDSDNTHSRAVGDYADIRIPLSK